MRQWIDFKQLRSRLRFADVLKHYGVSVTLKKDQAVGFCPLPGHQGDRRTPSFSANLKRNIWQCFGCGAKGNVLDFAIRMERLSPENKGDVRKVALKLAEHFEIQAGALTREVQEEGEELFKGPHAQTTSETGTPATVNEPLDFELKGLRYEHPYLIDRGFSRETIARFGLGYCARGLMARRIVIPLDDARGRLVGYAGRLVDDTAITERSPKYKFPTDRQRLGVLLEFRKSALLYNAHRIKDEADHLVVVEGFPSVWWLTQMGVPNAVALMGSSCSPEQAAIILSKTLRDGYVFVMPDGDAAGERCAQSVFGAVGGQRWVQRIDLGPGRQPTDCGFEEVSKFFGV